MAPLTPAAASHSFQRTPYEDALGVNYLDIPDAFTSEDEALEALRAAATAGHRTTATWWIDNRATHAPMG